MWSRNINVFAQLEGNISPSPMVEFDTRLDKSYRQPRLPHSNTKHANNHNHTGKEGPDAMLPSCYWQLSMIETSEQKLHQRQQVAILSLNASLGSSVQQAAGNPPHSVKERSQGTLQAARWTRLHFSLVCSESAAFNHSLTAAAGSTGSGAMPLSLWAENLSLLYLRNLDPSMQYTHRNSYLSIPKMRSFSLECLHCTFHCSPKTTPWLSRARGVLHRAMPSSIRGWLARAGTVIMKLLTLQYSKLMQSRLSRAMPFRIRAWLLQAKGVLLWGAFFGFFDA